LKIYRPRIRAVFTTGNAKEIAMSQNMISLTYTNEQLQGIDQMLENMEFVLSGFVALDGAERRGISRMGSKSEQFCRQTLSLLAENAQIVPASMPLAEALSDLATLDALRPRLVRLRALYEKGEDTETALGSDVMAFCLEGYALLKVAGKNQGLEDMRKGLSGRFARTRAPKSSPPAI
jgi:hypothetical protein